jgi:predicted Zn-dependent protease
MVDLTKGNDDELAAIMGYEIAHAIARHGAERMSQVKAAQISLGIGGMAVAVATKSQDLGTQAAQKAGALVQLGVLLPYSRLHESEADHIGAILAAKAGYDPRAAIRIWEKMSALYKGDEPYFFLSTHPLNADRIKGLKEIMDEAMKYYRKKDSSNIKHQ